MSEKEKKDLFREGLVNSVRPFSGDYIVSIKVGDSLQHYYTMMNPKVGSRVKIYNEETDGGRGLLIEEE